MPIASQNVCQPAWPGGKALGARGKRKEAGSIARFGSTVSSTIVIYGHCLVALPCTVNDTFKMAHIAAHVNAEIILVVAVSSCY